MVDAETRDGPRIAELLAAEVEGHERPPLGRLAVVDAVPDAEPSVEGTRSFDVTLDGEVVARAFVHADRVRLSLSTRLDAAREAATAADLRVRPAATRPPRLVVFVESGAEVKRALAVLRAVAGG